MKNKAAAFLILALMFVPAKPVYALGKGGEAPGKRIVVATVNGEAVYMDELNAAVAARHENMEDQAPTAWVGYEGALERLINIRLILQEANDIELGNLPEIREKVQRYREQMLIKLLKSQQLVGLEPDKDDIEKVYRDEVRHWKFRALSFQELKHAQDFRNEVVNDDDFDTVGEKFVEEGFAVIDGGEREVKEADVAPEILAAFMGKDVGSVTPVIMALDRFFVFKLTGVRFPEDPGARERAPGKAFRMKRDEVLKKYADNLIEKYAAVKTKVLSTINTPGYPEMEKDDRIVAEIDGEAPVLVSDLGSHLKGKFYHGERTSEYGKTIRSGPESILRDVLEERVYRKEALRTGVDGTDYYNELVSEYENSLVFGGYLEKFLVPQVEVDEEEIKAVYEENRDKYFLPRKIKVDSLVFADENSARKALGSLERGAELKWLSENARGLKEDGIVGDELTLSELPEDLQNLLEGAKPGDTGMYSPGDGIYNVYIVNDAPQRQVKPLEQVRSSIHKELFSKALNQVIEDLAAELRELSDITIYTEKLEKGPVPKYRD